LLIFLHQLSKPKLTRLLMIGVFQTKNVRTISETSRKQIKLSQNKVCRNLVNTFFHLEVLVRLSLFHLLYPSLSFLPHVPGEAQGLLHLSLRASEQSLRRLLSPSGGSGTVWPSLNKYFGALSRRKMAKIYADFHAP